MHTISHTNEAPRVNLCARHQCRYHAEANPESIRPLINVGNPAKVDGLPKNRHRVVWNRFLRLLLVGRSLFTSAALGLLLCYWILASNAFGWSTGSGVFSRVLGGLLACWSIGIVILALLDARSRFQDYMRAKDLFYENGFKSRIAKLYIYSKCQRDAARLAARDLGLLELLDDYYLIQGYRWYHIFPDFVLKKPWIVFSRRYWRRTLFEPPYTSSHFLW